MRKIIYFPSLSVGNPNTTLVKNFTYKNGISCRFYDSNLVPKELFYPYFLITAGNFYDRIDTRERFGIPSTSLLMGDSGGYQIATGVLKYSKELVSKIFNWLEINTDIAVNLDIPPWKDYSRFNECLDMSFNNFKYFYENQTGKTKFLNVLHGYDLHTYNHWYNTVKDFQFSGWCIGGTAGSFLKIISSIVTLLENKEHLKEHNKYFHILGTSKIMDTFLLIILQKIFQENSIDIQITTDSSTPSIMGAYGGWINHFSYDNLSFQGIALPKKGEYKEGVKIPASTLFDRIVLLPSIEFNDIIKYEQDGYISVILHNLYFILESIDKLHYLGYSDRIVQEQVFSKDIMQLIDMISNIIHDTSPKKVYVKYEYLLKKFDRKHNLGLSNDALKEFFEF